MWDPERRLKPQPAMRHPFMTAFRRPKAPIKATPSKTIVHGSSTSGRAKLLSETPKKSLIGAPTPLSARLTRAPTTSISVTPVSHSASATISSSRMTRASDASFQSSTSRALSGYAVGLISPLNYLEGTHYLVDCLSEMIMPTCLVLSRLCLLKCGLGCCYLRVVTRYIT